MMFFVHGANISHQRFITQVAATSNLPPRAQKLMKTGDADAVR